MAHSEPCGELITQFTTTLGRHNENGEVVAGRNISATDLRDRQGERVVVRLTNCGRNGPIEDPPTSFETTVHESQPSFSIPKDVAEREGFLPGHSVTISIHETAESPPDNTDTQQTITDGDAEWRTIGTAKVVSDSSANDGIDSKLYEPSISNSLDGEQAARFTNKRNNNSAIGATRPLQDNRASFPKSVRSSLDVQPGDIISVAIPDGDAGRDIPELEQKIDEMHKMVSELYSAYTND